MGVGQTNAANGLVWVWIDPFILVEKTWPAILIVEDFHIPPENRAAGLWLVIIPITVQIQANWQQFGTIVIIDNNIIGNRIAKLPLPVIKAGCLAILGVLSGGMQRVSKKGAGCR